LYENKGWGNFGRAPLEAVAGLRGGMLTSTSLMGKPIAEWRVKAIDREDDPKPLLADDANDADWQHFTLDGAMAERLSQPLQPGSQTAEDDAARILFGRRRLAVYRSSIELTDADLNSGRTRLNFDKIDDTGRIFVNGKEVGQSKSYDKPAAFDVAR